MKAADIDAYRRDIVAMMKLAALSGTYGGLLSSAEDRAYMSRCRQLVRREGVALILTRDIGYHTSGWWKNPDFERCVHLSVSFFDPLTLQPAGFRRDDAAAWARLFFGDDMRKTWVEPPYTAEGKLRGVHHYRLFYDEHWESAIKPRGEVYSKELTEKGWKSFSELHGDDHNADPPQGMAP